MMQATREERRMKYQAIVDRIEQYVKDNKCTKSLAFDKTGISFANYYGARKKLKKLSRVPVPQVTVPAKVPGKASKLICFIGTAEDIREALRTM